MRLGKTGFCWMVMAALGFGVVGGWSQSAGPPSRVEEGRSKAAHEARLKFANQRKAVFDHGLYQDYRAMIRVETNSPLGKDGRREVLREATKSDAKIVVLADPVGPTPDSWRGLHEGILFLAGSSVGAGGELWLPEFNRAGTVINQGFPIAPPVASRRAEWLDPRAPRFRDFTTHLLCRELTESSVRESLQAGRSYLADDWLCDPRSFAFVGIHNLGVFTLGDAAPANPLFGGATTLLAATPVPAHLKIFHKGRIVAEAKGSRLDFDATDPGAYRIEAWLDVAGVEQLWISSNPIYLDNSIVSTTRLPPAAKPESVEVKRGIVYTEAPTPDPNKHKLDVYSPRDGTNSPVFFFIHGGAWRLGDRTQFFPVGNRFARDGFVTVIPSYRLAPRSPYPAQIEDCAAAFAWMVREISKYGGDTNRIYLGGHSAGGHLAALLALDRQQLASVGLSPNLIKGVIGISGVYDLNAIGESQSEVFGRDPKFRRASSPITYVNEHAPPFLVTYCEHEYFSLPAQARAFDAALRGVGARSELWYSPGENHVAEIYSFCLDHDPTADQMLRFMGR
jgi:acetyl esterase/lipase